MLLVATVLVHDNVDAEQESSPSRTRSLRLSIRQDTDERDVDIRLTLKSLGLILWLGFGIILLYEVLAVFLVLVRRQIRNKRNKPVDHQQGLHVLDPVAPLPLLILWFISTAYGMFYSFEMVFLYINDNWYSLLGIQLLFSVTDIFVWCWMVGHFKYQFWGKSTIVSTVCLIIKFNHMLFNIVIERGIWSPRHWLFCLEDMTCLLLARVFFGQSVKAMAKPLTASGLAVLLTVVSLFRGSRMT